MIHFAHDRVKELGPNKIVKFHWLILCLKYMSHNYYIYIPLPIESILCKLWEMKHYLGFSSVVEKLSIFVIIPEIESERHIF